MLKRVLRSLLRVGTLRAQYSKCHSRHFFISPTRGTSGHWKGWCRRSQKGICSSEWACKKKLAHEFGLPHFLLFPKIGRFWEPGLIEYLCGSSPIKKIIPDLLHSNESKRISGMTILGMHLMRVLIMEWSKKNWFLSKNESKDCSLFVAANEADATIV